jgi:hypothetical protein
MEIPLYTRSGDFVVAVEVPIMTPMVEVINWGNRYFVLNQQNQYVEGLVWYIFPGWQCDDALTGPEINKYFKETPLKPE